MSEKIKEWQTEGRKENMWMRKKAMKQSLNAHSINPKISLFFAFFVTEESWKGRETGTD